VGFGDFHPKNDAERLLCAFILFFGVAVFSVVMENFSNIIIETKAMDADLND